MIQEELLDPSKKRKNQNQEASETESKRNKVPVIRLIQEN